jgi:hypothetical protein
MIDDTSDGPGRTEWAPKTLRNSNLNNAGPLRGLCGYYDKAPADVDKETGGPNGKAVQIASDFAFMVNLGAAPDHTGTGDVVLNAWLEANRRHNAQAITYDRHNYWYVINRRGLKDRVSTAQPW